MNDAGAYDDGDASVDVHADVIDAGVCSSIMINDAFGVCCCYIMLCG